jgi:hypothetical protein
MQNKVSHYLANYARVEKIIVVWFGSGPDAIIRAADLECRVTNIIHFYPQKNDIIFLEYFFLGHERYLYQTFLFCTLSNQCLLFYNYMNFGKY